MKAEKICNPNDLSNLIQRKSVRFWTCEFFYGDSVQKIAVCRHCGTFVQDYKFVHNFRTTRLTVKIMVANER
jgi:hypothetical protein